MLPIPTSVSASSNASLTGLDPLGQQQAALANLAAANPFLMAQQNLATLGQNASQFQAAAAAQHYQQDPLRNASQATAGNPSLPVYSNAATAQVQSPAAASAGLLPTGAIPGLNGLMLNPGLLRLPGLAQPGASALYPMHGAGAAGLLQNPALMAAAAANQQRMLLQQQQNAALILQQQQRQSQLAQMSPQLAAAAAAGGQAGSGGKRSFEQAFALAAATNTPGGKRVYSASPTISANPTSYNTPSSGSN